MEETNMSETMLENRIVKLESEIKELKTELSIALEFYGQVYELISELNHILKTRQLQKDKQDLKELEGFSLVKCQKDMSSISRESVLDTKLRKAVNYIFQDYYSQGSG
jgi:vacuolar-type H+-ATPase subunit I/STV1